LPSDNLSIAVQENKRKLRDLNDLQVQAVKQSLRGHFTLIQGPPGELKQSMQEFSLSFWSFHLIMFRPVASIEAIEAVASVKRFPCC